MTQQDLKEYLLLPGHNCQLYDERVKDDGVYYFIRNCSHPKKMKVVYPLKKGTYSPAAVCEICMFLDVPTPNYGKRMESVVSEAKAETEKIPKDILDKINEGKENGLNMYATYTTSLSAEDKEKSSGDLELGNNPITPTPHN